MVRIDPDGASATIALDGEVLRTADGEGPATLSGLAAGPLGALIIADGSALWSLTGDGERP
jgi:hypothetical protein